LKKGSKLKNPEFLSYLLSLLLSLELKQLYLFFICIGFLLNILQNVIIILNSLNELVLVFIYDSQLFQNNQKEI